MLYLVARDTSEPATLVRLDLNTKVTFVIISLIFKAFGKKCEKVRKNSGFSKHTCLENREISYAEEPPSNLSYNES